MDKEETIKKFVRDVCSVFPIPKSEVRRRLNDLFKAQREDLLEQMKEINKNIKDHQKNYRCIKIV